MAITTAFCRAGCQLAADWQSASPFEATSGLGRAIAALESLERCPDLALRPQIRIESQPHASDRGSLEITPEPLMPEKF
jgi:hypothetical protein